MTFVFSWSKFDTIKWVAPEARKNFNGYICTHTFPLSTPPPFFSFKGVLLVYF